MLVGFSRYGKGGGDGPVGYMTQSHSIVLMENGERVEVERDPLPVVLGYGDPEQTRELIDSLDFQWKYTSGVLSFAPGEVITEEMEKDIMARFEKTAFAGLDQDQYNILWVRHTHAGHHELHFVTPRVELETGKSFNIKPPGKSTQEKFDTFRSLINAEYRLADPDDPSRARIVKLPDHIAKQKNLGHDPREIVTAYLARGVENGLIKNRWDVVTSLQEAGFEINRQGKDYISIKDPETQEKYRLKGDIYAIDFQPNPETRAKIEATAREYRNPSPQRIADLRAKLERFDQAGAEFNTKRYPKPNIRSGEEIARDAETPNRHGFSVEPVALSAYLDRGLGNDALLQRADTGANRDAPIPSKTRGEDSAVQLRTGGGETVREGGDRASIRDGLHDFEGVLNDEPRNAIARRIGEAIERVQDVCRGFGEKIRAFGEANNSLTDACRALVGSTNRLGNTNADIENTSRSFVRSAERLTGDIDKVLEALSRTNQKTKSQRDQGMSR